MIGIDCTPGSEHVEFNQGRFLELGQKVGGLGDDIMKAQVYETVEQYLKKERALKGEGIKVLSLFFIDRVANYRIYNDVRKSLAVYGYSAVFDPFEGEGLANKKPRPGKNRKRGFVAALITSPLGWFCGPEFGSVCGRCASCSFLNWFTEEATFL